MTKLNRRLYLWIHDRLSPEPDVFSPHGLPVRIPRSADGTLRYTLARRRPYELPEANLIRAYISPDMPVVELGGCMGVVSATIRHRIGPRARHVVVEAIPELAAICRVNASAGAEPGATVVIEAAVDYSGSPTVTFATGHSAHVGHVATSGEPGITVGTITLSALASEMPAGSFALVCDIEGGELALFEHDAQTLARVDVLVLETHPHVYPNGDQDLRRLLERIESLGLRQVAEMEQVYGFRRLAKA